MSTSRYPTTIRGQILRAIMLTSGLVLVLAAAALVLYEAYTLRRSTAEHLTSLAQAVAETCAPPLALQNKAEAQAVLASLKREPNLQLAALYDARGEVFAAFMAAISPIPGKPGGFGHRFYLSAVEVIQPVEHGGQRIGTLYLRSDLEAFYERLQFYTALALGVVASSLLAGYILSYRLQGAITQPVLALAQAARTITEKNDYSVRAKGEARGELGLLTDAFNQMLEEIQHRATEEKQAREELSKLKEQLELRVRERTAQLHAANQELEAFTYTVSHDLQTPVRHIENFATIFAGHAGAGLDEQGRHYLQIISQGAERMRTMIEQLLQLSRLERAPLEEQEVNMPALVEEVRRELLPQTKERKVEWQIGPLPVVQGDSSLLHSVMLNLLGNAVKYTARKETGRLEVGCTPGENQFVFFVRDNGAGFDMRNVGKLFTTFQRLHSTREFEGSGVGLASVRRIVQKHGGKVWAEGAAGQGATFYFSLPPERCRIEKG